MIRVSKERIKFSFDRDRVIAYASQKFMYLFEILIQLLPNKFVGFREHIDNSYPKTVERTKKALNFYISLNPWKPATEDEKKD